MIPVGFNTHNYKTNLRSSESNPLFQNQPEKSQEKYNSNPSFGFSGSESHDVYFGVHTPRVSPEHPGHRKPRTGHSGKEEVGSSSQRPGRGRTSSPSAASSSSQSGILGRARRSLETTALTALDTAAHKKLHPGHTWRKSMEEARHHAKEGARSREASEDRALATRTLGALMKAEDEVARGKKTRSTALGDVGSAVLQAAGEQFLTDAIQEAHHHHTSSRRGQKPSIWTILTCGFYQPKPSRSSSHEMQQSPRHHHSSTRRT